MSEDRKRKRKVQPVALVVIEAKDYDAGQKIEDEAIHDLVSARKFVVDNELDGRFEVIKILGTVSTSVETKRKVVVQ